MRHEQISKFQLSIEPSDPLRVSSFPFYFCFFFPFNTTFGKDSARNNRLNILKLVCSTLWTLENTTV